MLSLPVAATWAQGIGAEVPPIRPPLPEPAPAQAIEGREKTAIGASDRGFACYLSRAQPGAVRRGIARTPPSLQGVDEWTRKTLTRARSPN
ncbi:DUF6053 domain-containing protein [Lysobacter enzymogenes]|uniref:DUF6053 domain-containing protein n=1 Tax=Lysobacter enzymogenes TaxID=69 RepID=UPI003D18A0BD